MKLVIFNGSPRLEKSNSTLLINRFLNGYHKYIDNDVEVFYLARTKAMNAYVEAFKSAEAVIVIFPLYTDAMPGVVKAFFEALAANRPLSKVKLGFIVQSGFPEGIHCENIKHYLQKFTLRLGCDYMGTLTKGGVEGIQIMPPFMTRKLFLRFYQFGEHFALNGEFSAAIMKELREPYRLSFPKRMIMKALSSAGITNFYWNTNLKKHKAYPQRYAKPFQAQ
jgi:NAD(P)H-dependent FMN reductase